MRIPLTPFLSAVLCLACAAAPSPGGEITERTMDDTARKSRGQAPYPHNYDRDGTMEVEAIDQIDEYRARLENRLLERYNNLPGHSGNVGKVTVALSRPPETSLDGTMIRAEFDQLVYDPWGKRIPELEKEYYVVTFGSGGVRNVRTDPSIRVGLNLEKTYSERATLAADPFKRIPEAPKERPEGAGAAETKMPDWWRPDFPELQ